LGNHDIQAKTLLMSDEAICGDEKGITRKPMRVTFVFLSYRDANQWSPNKKGRGVLPADPAFLVFHVARSSIYFSASFG